MHKHSQLKNFIFKTLSEVLLGMLISMVFLPVLPKAKAADINSTQNYIIKLSSPRYFGDLVTNSNIKRLFLGSPAPEFQNIYSFSSSHSLESLKKGFAGEFEYLETSKTFQTQAVLVNDPGFTTNPLDVDKQWGIVKAGFNQAWEKTLGSKSTVVALIDTGVDETHQDLQSITYVPGFDFVNQQPITNSGNYDDNGHGTLVAGVLGASANNGLGVVGTNWQISIMPIKALDATGKGDSGTVSQAIIWAADHGAQIINLSVGGIGFGHDTTLANAISYAFNKNVLIVAAAGNDSNAVGQSLDQNPVFPICDDNNYNMVIGVAATDQNDLKADFSNYGRNCIDVAAPGKRIMSTINYDPLTKKPAPNSYAYASGTSMGVPFVVGEAALIKALYPTATNIQIRDRIIATADPIDNLNLSQCGGSCAGQLGAGRINVPKSLMAPISQAFSEGDLVKLQDLGVTYQIVGGQKRLVSPFVFNQRFSGAVLKSGSASQLSGFPEGPYVTPNDGTLVKLDSSPTVYIMENGEKLPITYQVFLQRKLNFSNINTLSFGELNSWVTGNFYAPVDGSLLRTVKNQTVYWVVGQVLHPINHNFYVDRGLNIFPVLVVPDADIASYSKGEAYIR